MLPGRARRRIPARAVGLLFEIDGCLVLIIEVGWVFKSNRNYQVFVAIRLLDHVIKLRQNAVGAVRDTVLAQIARFELGGDYLQRAARNQSRAANATRARDHVPGCLRYALPVSTAAPR